MAASDKVSSGEAFRPPLAQTWNAMVDAGEAHRASRLSKTEGAPHRPRETDKIKCKNASGAARRRGEILGDFTNPLTNLEPDKLRLSGSLPAEGTPFGILLKATPNNKYGELQLSGACIALVDIESASHGRANCDGSSHVLISSDEGPIEILYAPSGTGEQECFVRFGGSGGGSGGGTLYRFMLIGSLSSGSIGATFYDMETGEEVDFGSIYDPEGIFAELDDGDRGLAIKQGGRYYVIQAHCPDEGD